MKTFEQAQTIYKHKMDAIKKVNAKILERKQQLVRLNKKKSKLFDNVHWTEDLIRPVMELVKAEFPTIVWDDEDLVPLGMCSRVCVFGKIEGEVIARLSFTTGDIYDGILFYDTGERDGDFQPNSIGAMNGLGNIREMVTDINVIYAHIIKQLGELTGKDLEVK